jgi:uncharacterized protein
MKKILLLLFVFSFVAVSGQNVYKLPDNPARLVNDFAHVMTADQISSLEQKLVAYDDSTSIQIAIVTVLTTHDTVIDDYALGILRASKVGNKKTNNGLVILAAIKDHKVFIATGYGMEGAVPDITAHQIIENEIVPAFKQNDYYAGFNNGADAIIKASAGEYKAPAGYANRGKGSTGGGIFALMIIIVVIILIISRIGGGGSGGGGLFSGSGILPFIIGNMIGSAGRGGFGGGGGGGWSGGGGGGGFGGFGGGSGGGGGAGGSW